ncbi:hypothetical protein ACFO1B_39260 [Dactylosporangium siamense]|uniref:Uncharacterized protein n=1 Tax=Dactylosporangium siamense TaxID=685454 RepID=A0A919PV46_9ACTN|nr:hypothetical protein [Dactylosporangium siamense]GIG50282.1 hypothetical protein Dsi01nite_083230 [Dactylosporangium siamense]
MTDIDQSGGGAAPPMPAGRLRAAWRAAHAPVAGVPRWARVAAYAVPFVVLPSSLWRLPAAFLHGGGLGVEVYVVCLSIVAELVAFTAVGLVASWGERFPSWIPWLRGRTVPALVAVVPATVAAVFLTVLWIVAFIAVFRGVTAGGAPVPSDFPTQQGVWSATIFYICYLPLLLWGPLLAVVTYAYHRRRRQR